MLPSSPTSAMATATSSSPWAQSGWLSTEIKPLCSSPMLWTSNHDSDITSRHRADTDELVSNLVLPPPQSSPLHSPLPHDSFVSPNICDFSESGAMPSPSPSISQPFLTLPASQASKCAFPPSCPVLAYNKDTFSVEVGLVRSVVLDLNPHFSSTSGVFYDVESFKGATTNRLRVSEKDLQYAPQCPVWFQSLHEGGNQVTAVVLASYHAPQSNDATDCFYSVLVDSNVRMVHHGVRLQQLSYRPTYNDVSPVSCKTKEVRKDQHIHKGDRSESVPSEVVTSATLSDVSSTGSLSEPVTPRSNVEVVTPPGFGNENTKKLSTKIHLPTWIADTADLENDLLESDAKFLRRIEEKTSCILEVERVASDEDDDDDTLGHPVVTIYCDDAARLAGARTYVENFIIDRVHERLEGRLLYHFAVDQSGRAVRHEWKIVKQRGPENRKAEAWMTAIPLPSEDCIRAVIGKGGRFINFLRSITGCSVTLESRTEITTEPFVYITASEREKVEEAAALVEDKIQGKYISHNKQPTFD